MTDQPADQLAEAVDQTLVLGEDGKPLSKSALKKLQKEQEKAKKKAERAQQQQSAVDDGPDYAVDKYGRLPLNQSQQKSGRVRTRVEEIGADHVGKSILIRARLHTTRAKGKQCT